jgi:hypothetical protein
VSFGSARQAAVAATIRSRTRGSSRPGIAESSSERASPSRSPRTTSSGSPASFLLVSRLTHHEHQRDRLGEEVTGHEADHLRRGAIELLGVTIGHDHHSATRDRPTYTPWPVRTGR